MSFSAQYIPYSKTGSFSKIVTDYLDNAPSLQPFYQYMPDIDGIKKAMAARKKFNTDRSLLVAELRKQYAALQGTEKVNANIESLLNENTFTVCTAHQPNIFTGHLYFIYKIIHAIRLADELKKQLPAADFVPVYYMGSEDADLEELGKVSINGQKYHWKTDQQGAVGRMKIDKAFVALIDDIEGQLSVEPFGKEIISLVKKYYTLHKTIEQATLEFVHELFAAFGLVIFLPDNPALKKAFTAINAKEISEQFSHTLVEETIAAFPTQYKVQAAGREINLFYLKDNIRERINREGDKYKVQHTAITFTEAEIKNELEKNPERFSQNVILRPVYQELILPNIAFIGGGGELAYWLELKRVFEAAAVPFPVLVLRNSFMIVNLKAASKIKGLGFDATSFFRSEKELVEEIVKKESSVSLDLAEEKRSLLALYHNIKVAATAIDVTLNGHVGSLETIALKRIEQLEKKMLKSEKKKFEAQQRHIQKVRNILFPSDTLQERVDNLLPYYAVYGKGFIEMLYRNSTGLQQEFCIIEEM